MLKVILRPKEYDPPIEHSASALSCSTKTKTKNLFITNIQ